MSKICQCNSWKVRSCFLEGIESFKNCPWCGSDLEEEKAEKVESDEAKESALNEIAEVVSNFLYYDRKEDEDLTFAMLTELLEGGKLRQEEIMARFAYELNEQIAKNFNVKEDGK